MTALPAQNDVYGTQEYWKRRFGEEETYEWLVDYSRIRNYVRKWVASDASILILGCGNSLLGHDMMEDGYELVHSLDYCENVVDKMSSHCQRCSGMSWTVSDAKSLPFRAGTFDVVIEKATIDTFLVGESSVWNLSSEASKNIEKVLQEVSRVLTENGLFLSISFNEPIFRAPIYSSPVYRWGIKSIEKIGGNFHHHLYGVQKGLKDEEKVAFPRYEPPKVIEEVCGHEESEKENDIFDIIL